jgi:hypothetical protein
MAHFIDRRLNGKNKSAVNRQRFIRRYKQQIKKAVAEAISNRSVTDISRGENVVIPSKDISEPFFYQGKGGRRQTIHPGNDQFSEGDRIARPQGGASGPGQGDASADGEGSDEFVFSISKEEYLDLLFEDLALPNLQKNQLDKLVQYKSVRAGYRSEGVPSTIDIVRSLRGSLARRVAMTAGKKAALALLEQQLQTAEQQPIPDQLLRLQLLEQITILKKRIAAVPFIDSFDLRFRNYQKKPEPTSKAVMFCLMDVSGSMDQPTKDMAKRFYILLYLFLSRSYKNVEVVYIRHHTQAKEVDEQEFFYSQETGGTIVSSALRMMHEIITDRYDPAQWNIYAAQASDGDNWTDDSAPCAALLANKLLPLVRYYAYIEISPRAHQSLWHEYEKLLTQYDNIAIEHIRELADIYPVFRQLFKKQAA